MAPDVGDGVAARPLARRHLPSFAHSVSIVAVSDRPKYQIPAMKATRR